MPNLISVTTHGDPRNIARGKELITSTGLQNHVPEPVKRFAGDAFEAMRGVNTIKGGHPIGYVINELMFPQHVADGTLKGKPGFE